MKMKMRMKMRRCVSLSLCSNVSVSIITSHALTTQKCWSPFLLERDWKRQRMNVRDVCAPCLCSVSLSVFSIVFVSFLFCCNCVVSVLGCRRCRCRSRRRRHLRGRRRHRHRHRHRRRRRRRRRSHQGGSCVRRVCSLSFFCLFVSDLDCVSFFFVLTALCLC